VDGSLPTPWWFTGAAAIRRRKRHQAVFVAAGLYNLVWGAFTAASPQWLFDVAGMEAANHPQVFAALGMVVGLYGFMYLSVAAYPEYGWLTAAVGLTGKILGRPGWPSSWQGAHGLWPRSSSVSPTTSSGGCRSPSIFVTHVLHSSATLLARTG
jgi:hypothetical protein